MDPELVRYRRAIVDAHDDAFRALRAASEAMDVVVTDHGDAIKALGAANQRLAAANKFHRDAIDAALVANRAVIDMLDYLGRNGNGGNGQ